MTYLLVWTMTMNHQRNKKQEQLQHLLKQKWLLHKRAEYWKVRRSFPTHVLHHPIGRCLWKK